MPQPNVQSDDVPVLDNETGPATFRTTQPFARLAVSGSGTLKSWQGNAFDAGVTFTESQTITSPGHYEVTLDAPGYCTVQDANIPGKGA